MIESNGEYFQLRTAVPNDVGAVMAIERQAFIPRIQEQEVVFSERISAFPHGFLLLERENGVAAGYFCSELWAAPAYGAAAFSLGHAISESHSPDGTVLYVSSMALASDLRGRGLGAQLFAQSLRAVLAVCPQVRLMQLVVNEAWRGAKAIYERAGFRETARLAGFFPAEQDGVHTCGIVMDCSRECTR